MLNAQTRKAVHKLFFNLIYIYRIDYEKKEAGYSKRCSFDIAPNLLWFAKTVITRDHVLIA